MAETDRTTKPVSILIVEDDAIPGEALRRLLLKLGYRPVGPAMDAETALALAEREKPDLALVDIMLPEAVSGLALGEGLLAGGVPVVFVTGHREGDVLSVVEAIRPYGLVFKPVDRYQLAVAVEGALRRRAEEELVQSCLDLSASERRFRAVFEQAGIGVALIGTDRVYREVNECFARMVGRTPLDLAGRSVNSITHPDDQAADAAAMARLTNGEVDSLAWEKRYLRADGSPVWCRVNVTMLRADGIPEGLVTVAEDITDRRLAEEALHDQLAFQQSLMDAAVNPIYVQDPEGHYVSINKAFAAFLGVTIESAQGLTAAEIFSEETGRLLTTMDQEILAQGGVQHFEINLEDASGRERDLVFHRARFDDATGRPRGIVGVATDVTERKQVEKDLRDEQEVLRLILAGIRAGIFIIDPATHRIVDVNPMAEELSGRPREELLGQSCAAICWRNTEGRPVTDCPLADHNIVDVEMRLTRPDGRVVPIMKTVIMAKQRGQTRLFEIVFDITERKALERQLATAQKLESIGELAAGIAHEINTPTQYIGDNLHFLSGSFASLQDILARIEAVADRVARASGDEAAVREIEAARDEADLAFLLDEMPRALEQSVEGVSRVTAIVSAMKKFSHPGGEDKTAVDLNAAVENTVIVAKNEWKYVADVELDLDRNLPPVLCLPGDMNQVILNILVNAAHAIGDTVKGTTDKGRITIRTEADGEFFRLAVSDTGKGIAEENRSKIFDPFFTTKDPGKGTGQGLAITHNIVVAKHGGTIDFESELGKGTTFVVRIPFGSLEATTDSPEILA